MADKKKQLKKLLSFKKDGKLASFKEVSGINEKLDSLLDVSNESLNKIEKGSIKSKVAFKDSTNIKTLKSKKGDKGDEGTRGPQGLQGIRGEKGERGLKGEKGKIGLGKDGRDGLDGKDGKNGKQGKDGKDGSPDKPEQIARKLETLQGNKRLDFLALKNRPTVKITRAKKAGGGGGGAPGGVDIWEEVTATTKQMLVNTGYVTNNASRVELTLPATAAFGDVIKVVGKGAGGWRINQNAGQTINFGFVDTVTGINGLLDSVDNEDAIALICTTVNTGWTVFDPQGNIDVVDLTAFANNFSMRFDGVDEYQTVPHNASIQFARTDSFSVSFWATTVSGRFWEKRNGNNRGYELRTLSGGFQFLYWGTSTSRRIDVTTGSPGGSGFRNFIVTYNGNDANNVRIYSNAVSLATTVVLNNLNANESGNVWQNGRSGDGVGSFSGDMDEMSVWDTDLTPTQVAELYNLGTPTDLTTHSASANLVAWWRQGEGATFTTDWSIPDDSINSNTATSVNMEFADRITDTP